MSSEQDERKLYVTISSKPLGIAAAERLPIVQVSVDAQTTTGDDYINIMKEAQKIMEAGNGTD